jgi:hypothetical protein
MRHSCAALCKIAQQQLEGLLWDQVLCEMASVEHVLFDFRLRTLDLRSSCICVKAMGAHVLSFHQTRQQSAGIKELVATAGCICQIEWPLLGEVQGCSCQQLSLLSSTAMS